MDNTNALCRSSAPGAGKPLFAPVSSVTFRALPTAALMFALCGAGAAIAQATPPSAAAPAPAAPQPVTADTTGRANLNISPKRVTLDRNHRSASVYVFNQGAATATFDISLVDRVMLLDGQIISVADAQAKPASKAVADRVKSALPYLQISPRRVTLGPSQGQTIRLRVATVPNDAGVAEVRSHLTIATIPSRESGLTAEAASAATAPNELRFSISALFGLSIPALVRLGPPDVKAGLENAAIRYPQADAAASRTPVLDLDLVRHGANSLFGVVEVRVQGQPRKEPPIGLARGVGVYTEIDRRTMHIALSRAPAPGEHLEVTFTDDDTSPGKLLAKLVL